MSQGIQTFPEEDLNLTTHTNVKADQQASLGAGVPGTCSLQVASHKVQIKDISFPSPILTK